MAYRDRFIISLTGLIGTVVFVMSTGAYASTFDVTARTSGYYDPPPISLTIHTGPWHDAFIIPEVLSARILEGMPAPIDVMSLDIKPAAFDRIQLAAALLDYRRLRYDCS